MTVGNPFGLALYDKQQREVSSPEARLIQLAQVLSPAAAPSDAGLAALDPATIRQLHTTIRSLPAPLLAGFTKAFRKRFQVPEEAPSIADRILQKRHHDWIEAFLVQHHASASSRPDAQPG